MCALYKNRSRPRAVIVKFLKVRETVQSLPVFLVYPAVPSLLVVPVGPSVRLHLFHLVVPVVL